MAAEKTHSALQQWPPQSQEHADVSLLKKLLLEKPMEPKVIFGKLLTELFKVVGTACVYIQKLFSFLIMSS